VCTAAHCWWHLHATTLLFQVRFKYHWSSLDIATTLSLSYKSYLKAPWPLRQLPPVQQPKGGGPSRARNARPSEPRGGRPVCSARQEQRGEHSTVAMFAQGPGIQSLQQREVATYSSSGQIVFTWSTIHPSTGDCKMADLPNAASPPTPC
jgi:hypothetical protein